MNFTTPQGVAQWFGKWNRGLQVICSPFCYVGSARKWRMDKRKKHIMNKRPVVRPGLDHDRIPHERNTPSSQDIMQEQKHIHFGKVAIPRRLGRKAINPRFGS